MKLLLLPVLLLTLMVGCQKKDSDSASNELWIYTSLYKDVIADLTPRLEKAFPGVKIQFYQAGSEEVTAKLSAEQLAGQIKADILIFSDRFWFEDAAKQGLLFAYRPAGTSDVADTFKHPDGLYATVSMPVMVLGYNSEVISADQAPKTFHDLSDPKWKAKVATGSPLSSGTNFTTYAMLMNAYGEDFLKALRANEILAEGGNSAVIGRMQSKERPLGFVLLENILRLQVKDPRIKFVIPGDGVAVQTNVLAITNVAKNKELAQKVADWMFQDEGQQAMVRGYMYSPFAKVAPPTGAPEFSTIMSKLFAWTPDFLSKTTAGREQLKEKMSQILFQ